MADLGESKVVMKITNPSAFDLTYVKEWYDQGGLESPYKWPQIIPLESTTEIEVLSTATHVGGGCSGYVVYIVPGGGEVTIAFSSPWKDPNNPTDNALAIGTGDSLTVWANMTSNDYEQRQLEVQRQGWVNVVFTYQCTPGKINVCTINITHTSPPGPGP